MADVPVATMDNDGSIQIISNRLTPVGARLLIDWLVAHERYFPDDQVEQEQSVVLPDDKFVTSDPGDIIIKRKGDGCTQDEAV